MGKKKTPKVKYGKIGAPGSEKRKKHMASIRPGGTKNTDTEVKKGKKAKKGKKVKINNRPYLCTLTY